MKRGQTRIGIVLLCLVGLVAISGIVWVSNAGIEGLNVGEVYGKGIAQTTPLPRYVPGGPQPEFPSGPDSTVGSRTPLMIFFKGEFRTIREMSICWNDVSFKIPSPQEAFSCYSVPTTSPAEEVTGWFWPSSESDPKPFYQIGGDVYCYERTPYDRQQLMERIYELGKEKGWTMGKMNGEDVVLCQKGQKFLYPQ
ncbi:hypothetical protein HY489_06005 [Candidatus Woesearchaeota archaeon]|nr:hypothetical protein [Candidatus Woesearchaeota archaeon]